MVETGSLQVLQTSLKRSRGGAAGGLSGRVMACGTFREHICEVLRVSFRGLLEVFTVRLKTQLSHQRSSCVAKEVARNFIPHGEVSTSCSKFPRARSASTA